MHPRRFSITIALALALIAAVVIAPRSATVTRAQDIARTTRFDDALLIAFVSNRDGDEDIYVIPWDGWEGWDTPITPLNRTLNDQNARDWAPVWSHDGARIAFNSDRDGADRIYIMDADGLNVRPLFNDSISTDLAPAWSPDGARIAFVSDRGGIGRDIYVANANGTDIAAITRGGAIKGDPVWTPDGLGLTYWERQIDGVLQVLTVEVANPSRIRPGSFSRGATGMAFWSADGARLFYESDRDGDYFRLYSADSSGNGARALTDAGVHSGRATIAPDDSLIIFTSDRDQSDELYLSNADGSAVERLTDNLWSDHSPAWQPAVPSNAAPIVEPTPAPTSEPTPGAAPSGSSFVGALGQSGNGFEIHPIGLQTLRDAYGITAWHQAGWRGQGMRIGVIDLGFGGLFALESSIGRNIVTPPLDDRRSYDVDSNDHGRRVLEVINAVAPDAELFACRYDGAFGGFEACKDFLAQEQRVNVINHSAGLPVFPLDGRNNWAREASDANDLNILWINSAGNFQQGFYSADFNDVDGDGLHEFVGGSQPIEALEFQLDSPYRGNIILTWEQQSGTSADFDLEIVDSAGRIIRESKVRQGVNTADGDPVQPAEAILLDVRESFAVRIRDAGRSFGVVRLALVVEYLSIDEANIPNTSRDRTSIAPADSVRVVSVGAVQTIEQAGGAGAVRLVDRLAPYSSFGLIGEARYNKPDVMAYGDLAMLDGTPFFGTSAAAPIIAGAMALYWTTEDNLTTAQLRDRFFAEAVYRPDDYSPITHGQGVMRLPPPPARFGGGATTGSAAAKIVFPQPDVTVVVESIPQCGGSPARLSVGEEGYVNYDLGLFFRAEPGTTSTRIGPAAGLQLGEEFVVLDGPACGGSTSWWQIQLNDGAIGWLAEGKDYYLTAPSNYVSAELPTVYDTTCPNAPDMEVAIGDRVLIQNQPAGGLTLWRDPNRRDIIGGMEEGAELHILGGPVCSVDRAIRRWYVRVVDGRWQGHEGWTSEARPTERWLARRGAG